MSQRILAFRLLVILLALGIHSPAGADEPAAKRPATIQDFTWLSGHWQGGDEGELVEESWGVAHQGMILGMFRQDSPRQTFYELFTLAETEAGGMELRIRHFSPGLVAWEDKDESVRFVLTDWQENHAAFVDEKGSRLIYQRDGDSLVAALENDRDGATQRFEFVYRRAPL